MELQENKAHKNKYEELTELFELWRRIFQMYIQKENFPVFLSLVDKDWPEKAIDDLVVPDYWMKITIWYRSQVCCIALK